MEGESKPPIHFSPPFVDAGDLEEVQKAIDSGWIAPAGPHIDAFENALKERFGYQEVLAVNSGTSALHLALLLAGVSAGDRVLIGTFTFIAASNVVSYLGAVPVFIDSDTHNWNVSPELLREYVQNAKIKPKAIIVTHIFGIPALMNELLMICEEYGIVLIEDAAEALGSKWTGRDVGTFGAFAGLSFNGNKIITTSGGGALVLSGKKERDRGLKLATQAKEHEDHYEHLEVGFNYRMSNILAALGLGQLSKFNEVLIRKKRIADTYKNRLSTAGVIFYDSSDKQTLNHWVNPILLDGISPSDLVRKMTEENIEARRFWKPLHLQPLHKDALMEVNGVSEKLFNTGICLPSGAGMTEREIDRVCSVMLSL
ncbi:DegT/DnrJ/EryC1/StrS family aminotransferase [Marinoscillum sp.]|uniref:DegT/DnrJ/EryC1/StrS family aminotransferase n=1 Tax=Marinoscillum sp. TaxID=2024838 RepID=UPI003BAA4350